MKNTLKLQEKIGNGRNEEHIKKTLKAREIKDTTISFKINRVDKKMYLKVLKKEGKTYSEDLSDFIAERLKSIITGI